MTDESHEQNAVEKEAVVEGATPVSIGAHERRVRYIKRIAFDSVFAALALAIFVVELQIPLPLPIPGVKLGLSNVVTLFAMFALGPVDALVILAVRVGLGSLFAGSVMSLLYSAAGGAVCYLVTLLLRLLLSRRQIWVAGILGAVSHVSAQVAVAAVVTRTAEVFYYLPVLAAISLATGALTGCLAQFVYLRTQAIFAAYRPSRREADTQKGSQRQDRRHR